MSRDASETLRFLPVGLDVRGRECLVVGGGRVGARKIATLLEAGARVTLVAPAIDPALAGPIEAGRVRWVPEAFRPEHLGRALLAVAATDDEACNAAVVQAAADVGALVCDASSAERSTLIFGALLRLEDATVAVFTGGRDPSQSRRTRDRIAELLEGDSTCD